jgi:hypothetical protein
MPSAIVWRFAFAFGALLSGITFVLRWRYAFDSARFVDTREVKNAEAGSHAPLPKPPLAATLRAYWKPLLGTAGCWCLYDVVNYGLSLYSSDIVRGMQGPLGGGARGEAAGVLIVNLFALPGGLVAASVLPHIGRKLTLQAGTMAMLACFAVLAAAPSGALPQAAALIVFAFQSLMSRAGPGPMTYLLPGELFPVRVRATCHGISAAAGKARPIPP